MNRVELVLVLMFTFFVIVVWVTSEVIFARTQKPDDPKIQTMLEPLSPTFDQETMNAINNRQLSTPIIPTPRPTAAPTVQPQSSASPQPSPTPIATLEPIEAETELTIEQPSPTPLASDEIPLDQP